MNNGYLAVSLSKNNKAKKILVHRLVAETFLNRKNFKCMQDEDKSLVELDKLEVNHKKEFEKWNNSVTNLEWCTRKYNNNYGTKKERQALPQINNPKNSKKVNQYSLDGAFIKTWVSMKEVERQLGIRSQKIYRCCIGKRKSTGGYKWEYVKGE